MTPPRSSRVAIAGAFVVAFVSSATARAQPGAATPASPDDSILGTVEVDGSGGASLPPLPKLAIVPLLSTVNADTLVSVVVRRDLELSGQFEVLAAADAPSGPFTRALPLDLAAFGEKGAEYVLRVFSQVEAGTTQLVGEAYLAPKVAALDSVSKPRAEPKPAYRGVVDARNGDVRRAAHELVDLVLGALTGRPGGFASQLTYTRRVGRWQRAYVVDADGFNLHASGPEQVTVTSPSFGVQGLLYYSVSVDYAPFALAAGSAGTRLPVLLPGSLMGVAFSADGATAAFTTMTGGRSSLWTLDATSFRRVDAAPLANHPAVGPLGRVAYVGGTPVQRVYVDGKPISPAGLMASAPVFCDGPDGLVVAFSVAVGGRTDIVAMDTAGGRIRRLTQKQGSTSDPACSPDGRIVAFFSDTKEAKTSGLYMMPIARPWLAKKIGDEVGRSLSWSRAAR